MARAKKKSAARRQSADPQNAQSKVSGEFKKLEELIELMTRHGVAELDWETSHQRIHVKTPAACAQGGQFYSHPAPAPSPASVPASGEAPKPAVGSGLAANQKEIKSPFVGTFYRATSPTAEPYVREGQQVRPGQVLCIVEAMKLMNEIEAEDSGKIVSILVENAQPVEFGEPLFIIELG